MCFCNPPSINMLRLNLFYVKELRNANSDNCMQMDADVADSDGYHLGANSVYTYKVCRYILNSKNIRERY